MNIEKKNLLLAFITTLFFTLATPAIFPHLRLMFFVPFLIFVFYQKSFNSCLWIALGCGFLLDLLNPYHRLGFFGLNYVLTTIFLYREKRHFFADSLSTLPIMSFLFSFLSTILHLLLLYIFEKEIPMNWQWMITDVFLMPALDAFYAFAWFIFPFLCFGERPKKGKDFFLTKRP